MPLSFVRQDITKLATDAIVNAANRDLLPGGGVCGAIFAAAGYDELNEACRRIGRIETGSAVATPGFALRARYVIHTAGPIWRGGGCGERALLESCYRSSLDLAEGLGCRSIAFPLISSGIYGYPRAEAFAVAVAAIRSFLVAHPDFEVTLCLFDRRATTLAESLYGEIGRYIDDQYVEGSPFRRRAADERASSFPPDMAPPAGQGAPFGSRPAARGHAAKGRAAAPASAPMQAPMPMPAPAPADEECRSYAEHGGGALVPLEDAAFGSTAAQPPLDELLRTLDASFADTLLAMIDERGLSDAEVYGRANLSRQYFSKLRSGKVNPSKRVVCALAIALKLTLDETRLLLERAGHALTHASRFDIIVEWFITAGSYDVFEINQALFRFDQPLLGTS